MFLSQLDGNLENCSKDGFHKIAPKQKKYLKIGQKNTDILGGYGYLLPGAMPRPSLTVEDIQEILPDVVDIQFVDECGQKQVFSGYHEGTKFAYKFLELEQIDDGIFDDTTAMRAKREVETLKQCDCRYLVRPGKIGLQDCIVNNRKIIYYDEEYIDGNNLKEYFRDKKDVPSKTLLKLAYEISLAIQNLWAFTKVHRDIKPSNIMFEPIGDRFVLLDMGLVFDLTGESLSHSEVGTPLYFSPEQTEFSNRRNKLDFRSDMFSLGVVLYEIATGVHPFKEDARTRSEVLTNIVHLIPVPPKQRNNSISQGVNDMILRLLAKQPSLRYRSIEMFHAALNKLKDQ